MLLIKNKKLTLEKGSNGYFLTKPATISNSLFDINSDNYLINSLFDNFAQDDRVYISSLTNEKNKTLNTTFDLWVKLFLRDHDVSHLFYIDHFIFIVATIFLIVVIWEGMLLLFSYPIVAIAQIAIYFTVFILALKTKYRTKEASHLYNQWLCYKQYLEDSSLLEEKGLVEVQLWDDYLIYATALNINVKNDNNILTNIHVETSNLVRKLPQIPIPEGDYEAK
jgi:uncharacterized membrane protein